MRDAGSLTPMLTVGLTGGIGSGKSTVSARLAELGAVVIDADVIAREVVQPGTEGLRAVTQRFGAQLVSADGELDRGSLGRVVFGDEPARRDLEAILHPRIAARTRDLMAAAPDDAVVVHDVPLLVEKQMGPAYHLVVVVGADEQTRRERLGRDRGMAPQEARARIAAQATDDERRAAADVWLDNNGSRAALVDAVEALWRERLLPYDRNLRDGTGVERPESVTLAEPDPAWPGQATRIARRLGHLLGDRARSIEHVGCTSVPGLAARDVVDLQVGVGSLADLDVPEVARRLADGGFFPVAGRVTDRSPDGTPWPKRLLVGCDPGRAVHVHLREVGSPGWVRALRFRDWLRADSAPRQEYAALKRRLAADNADPSAYAAGKEPWFEASETRAVAWSRRTGWVQPDAEPAP